MRLDCRLWIGGLVCLFDFTMPILGICNASHCHYLSACLLCIHCGCFAFESCAWLFLFFLCWVEYPLRLLECAYLCFISVHGILQIYIKKKKNTIIQVWTVVVCHLRWLSLTCMDVECKKKKKKLGENCWFLDFCYCGVCFSVKKWLEWYLEAQRRK